MWIWYLLQIVDFFVDNSMRACKSIGRHVLGLESDKKLFGLFFTLWYLFLHHLHLLHFFKPYVLVAKKPKKVVVVKRRRIEDSE